MKNNQKVQMQYDGLGRRLRKSENQKNKEYLFDGLDIIGEYEGKNGQYNNFYRGDGNRIASSQHFPSGTDGQKFYYHYDALNSVVGLTKQNGQSDHNYRYSDFGSIEPSNGNFTEPHNSFTYTGQLYDNSMNLYEFYSRAYDPVTSTWLQQDRYRGEITNPNSLYRYQYVYNSPINLIDMYGYEPITISVVAGSSALAASGGLYLLKEIGVIDGSQTISLSFLNLPELGTIDLSTPSQEEVLNDLLFGVKNASIYTISSEYNEYSNLLNSRYTSLVGKVLSSEVELELFKRAEKEGLIGGEVYRLSNGAYINTTNCSDSSAISKVGSFTLLIEALLAKERANQQLQNRNLANQGSGFSNINPLDPKNKVFKSDDSLDEHFEKHKNDFNVRTKEEYEKLAQEFLNQNADGKNIIEYIRSNGDRILYNRITNEFGIETVEGIIRTYFKPTDGYKYFLKQIL